MTMDTILSRVDQFVRSAQLDVGYSWAIQKIESSPIPRLAGHFDLVLFSFAYFVLLDLFMYYVLAPQLCKLAPAAPNKRHIGLENLNRGGSLRTKWSHIIPSFVHALIAGAATTYFCFQDPGSLATSRSSRLFGFAPEIGNMLAFSIGYFLWDLFVCMMNPSIYGWSFVFHALMALVGLLAAYSPIYPMHYYLNRYLIFEISTVFVNLHWIFAKTGYDKSKRQFVSDMFALFSYLFVRTVYGYYTSWQLMTDMYEWYLTGQHIMYVVVLAISLQFITHCLNMYWFMKLLKSALKRDTSKPKAD